MKSPKTMNNMPAEELARVAPTRPGRAKFRKSFLWLFLPFLLYGLFLLWHNRPTSRRVPDELLGMWTTSAPAYAGRYFEFAATNLSFGTGPGSISTGSIESVGALPEDNRTLYTVDYRADGTDEIFSFYYSSGKTETIVLKNQPGIEWTKSKENEP